VPKSGGLPDVSQAISVDSSAAVSGYQAGAAAAEDFAQRNSSALRAVQDDLQQTRSMLKDFEQQASGMTGVPSGIAEWEPLLARMREAKQGIAEYASGMAAAEEAAGDFGDAQAAVTAIVNEHTSSLQEMTLAQRASTASVESSTTVVNQAADSYQDASESAVTYTGNLNRLEDAAKRTADALARNAATASVVSGSGYGAYDPNAIADLQGGLSSAILKGMQANEASMRYYAGPQRSGEPGSDWREVLRTALDAGVRSAAGGASDPLGTAQDLAEAARELKAAAGSARTSLGVNITPELIAQAAELVISKQSGSVSMLQKSLSMGYAKAKQVMDTLESQGVVGPSVAFPQSRQVLAGPEYLDAIKGASATDAGEWSQAAGDFKNVARALEEEGAAAETAAARNESLLAVLRDINGVMETMPVRIRQVTDQGGSLGGAVNDPGKAYITLNQGVSEYINLLNTQRVNQAEMSAVSRAQANEQKALAQEVAQIKAAVTAEMKQQEEDLAKIAQARAEVQVQAAREVAEAQVQLIIKQKLAADQWQAQTDKISAGVEKQAVSIQRSIDAQVKLQGRVLGSNLVADVGSGVLAEARTSGSYGETADVLLAANAIRESVAGKASIANSDLISAVRDIRVSAVNDAIGAVATGMAAASGGGNRSFVTNDLMDYARARAAEQAAGGGAGDLSSILGPAMAAQIASAIAAGGGGSGSAGGGGGGGGGVGGFFSSGFGDLFGNSGKADQQWDTVAKFITTWYPRFHWAMMATNEILATAGPAVVAAGAAVAVGAEGGQTAYGRLTAINTVGQSLGAGIGGETPGQILGLGDALQKAQTAADPQVWELMGAALNSIKAGTDSASGGLENFWQLGTNTIDMMDRFGAKVALGFQNGKGGALNSLVQGGTADLQDFGDVLGNIGDTFLNAAPVLPGVGGDLLGTLSGGTRLLADATGWASDIGALGPLLALEAGSRYGPVLVGGAGALTGRVGAGLSAMGGNLTGALGGFLGTQRTAATAEDVEYAIANGLPKVKEGQMIGGSGIAGMLGGMGPLEIGGAAAGAYLFGKGLSYQTPEQQTVAGMETAAGQDSFSKSAGDLLTSMSKLSTTAAQAPESNFGKNISPFEQIGTSVTHHDAIGVISGLIHVLDNTPVASNQSVAEAGTQKFAGQLNELLGAGQQVAKAFGTDLPAAFSLADMAGLQMSTAFGKNGQLTATAIQQVKDTITGYQAMSQGGTKGLEASINAVQATQGLAASKVGTVNTAWDTILSNAAGGTTAAVGVAAGIQALGDLSLPAAKGAPSAKTVKDIQEALGVSSSDAQALAASGGTAESFKSIAKALEGFTSPASQEAWSAFSNTSTSSPGVLQQVGSMLDTLRIAQTSSVLSPGQVAAAGMYQAKQLVPYAKQSPAALAELGVLSQETGGPGYVAGESQAKNYKNISQYIDKTAASTKEYNKILNDQAVGMSNVSQQAKTFGSTMQIDAYGALAEGSVNVPKMTSDMENFKKSITSGGEAKGFSSSAQGLAQDLASVKASAGDVSAILGQALSGKGLSASQIGNVINQVQSDISKLNGKGVNIKAHADTASAKAAIAGVKGKDVDIKAHADTSVAQSAINSVHGKSVTITVNEVMNMMGSVTGSAGGAPYTKAGGLANTPALYTKPVLSTAGFDRLSGFQTGWRVPGFGGGDIFPAMLEPGEAVVPKHLVGALAPFLGAHRVPGFADGGFLGGEMQSALSIASFSANNALGTGAGNLNSGQWGAMASSFMRVAMMARQMQAGVPMYAAGGIVPASTLAGVKAQIDAQYKTLDAMYAANDPKAQIDAFWSSVLDPLYSREDALEKPSSSGSSSSTNSTPGAGTKSDWFVGMPSFAGRSQGASSAAIKALEDSLDSEVKKSGIGKHFAVSLVGQFTSSLSGMPTETGKLAKALVSQISTEIGYAKNVSSAAAAGQGYGTAGLLTGLSAPVGASPPGTPGFNQQAWNSYTASLTDPSSSTGGQTVQAQLQTYLKSEQSFTSELKTLTKDGLSKSAISQLVAAGPTEGQALAQSILGAGGAKDINSLLKQITTASNALGAQAATSKYGGSISPNLNSATVTSNNVTINLDAKGGTTLSLSTSQIKQLTEIIQAKLLEQAKRNTKTGITIKGKSA